VARDASQTIVDTVGNVKPQVGVAATYYASANESNAGNVRAGIYCVIDGSV